MNQNQPSEDLKNFYDFVKKPDFDPETRNENVERHGIKLPFRMHVVGASGSMKTNTALNVIEQLNGTIDKIIVCCREKNEPLYEYMQDEIPQSQLEIIEIDGEDVSNLPEVDKFTGDEHTLIIYDDLVLLKDQLPIANAFIRMRKKMCSAMYLSQEYFGTPKVVRLNCNYTILKKVASDRDISLFSSEFRPPGMDSMAFKRLYFEATKNPKDFFCVAHSKNDGEKFYKNWPIPKNLIRVDNYM